MDMQAGEELLDRIDGCRWFEQDDRKQVLNSFRNIQEGLRRYCQNTRQTDITVSGGMERYGADKQLDLLFTSVDRKLYTAKNNGKNRIVE